MRIGYVLLLIGCLTIGAGCPNTIPPPQDDGVDVFQVWWANNSEGLRTQYHHQVFEDPLMPVSVEGDAFFDVRFGGYIYAEVEYWFDDSDETLIQIIEPFDPLTVDGEYSLIVPMSGVVHATLTILTDNGDVVLEIEGI